MLAAFLAFCRVGSCFLIMPGLSSVRVPQQVRLFVALGASLSLALSESAVLLPVANGGSVRFILVLVSEVLTGALIGTVARFYLMALQFMGSAIAMSIGYGGMGGPAIEEAEPQAALAAIISFSALLLLFLLDFHHEIIRALLLSYKALPPGVLFDPRSALADLTDTISESFFVCLRLGSPFIAYAILVNFAIGLVNKLTPQIPVYFISQPFVVAGGLVIFYFGVAVFLRLFADGFVPVTIGR